MSTPVKQDLPEVEDSILGVIIKESDCMDTVINILPTPDYFSIPSNRMVYKTILYLYNNNNGIDITTITERLIQINELKKAGGRVRLVQLVETYYTATLLIDYCEIVRGKYINRVIHAKTSLISVQAQRPDAESTKLIGDIDKILLDLSHEEKSEVVSVSEVIQEYADDLLTVDPNKPPGIKTRIEGVTRLVPSFGGGELIVIGGEPSMYKTSLAWDICLYNAEQGYRSLAFSVDQTRGALLGRALSNFSGITKNIMRSGKMTDEQIEELGKATAKLSALADKLIISDDPDMNALGMRAVARKINRTAGLDLIMIDYIGLIPSSGKSENQNLDIGNTLRIIKAMAKEIDVPILLVSQLNRKSREGNINSDKDQWNFPKPEYLRDSGSLEQDAYVILFPVVPYEILKKRLGEQNKDFKKLLFDRPELKNKAYVVVAKYKEGKTGTVECYRDPERMRFYSIDKQHTGGF